MSNLRRLILIAAGLALAVGSVSAPVAAAPGDVRVSLVQGVPRLQVDVCIDGQEVRSGLRYAKSAKRTVPAGMHTVKFFKSDARTCRGVLLGRTKLNVLAGQQWTVVVSRGAPKVVVWHASAVATAGVTDSLFLFGHAAKAGPVYLHRERSLPVEPDAFRTFSKGDHLFTYLQPGAAARVVYWMSRVSDNRTLAGPRERLIPESRLIESILVGTKPSNYRFAFINSPVPD